MGMNLQNVIDKIKVEGVEQAEKEAADIIAKAEAKAADLLSEAKEQSASLIKEAKEDAQKLKESGEEALKQAARDVMISLRKEIEKALDVLIKREVKENLQGDVLKDILGELIKGCAEKQNFDLEILLGEKEKEDLRSYIFDKFQAEISKGLTIKISKTLVNGIRIGKKGENVYIDFSDEAIAEAFNFYLNKKLQAIIALGK